MWTRIQSIDITIRDEREIPQETWDKLQQPSEQLAIFKIHFHDECRKITFSDNDRPVLDGNAPSLLYFGLPEYSGRVYIPLHSPSLHLLHTLSVSSSHTAAEVVQALVNMPYLESLERRWPISESWVDPKTKAHLPLLWKIIITADFETWDFFLKNIIPSKGCSLFLEALTNTGVVDEMPDRNRRLGDFYTALARYTEDYIDLNRKRINTLCYKCDKYMWDFNLEANNPYFISKDDGFNFDVSLEFCMSEIPQVMIDSLVSAVLYANFTALNYSVYLSPYTVEAAELLWKAMLSLLPCLRLISVTIHQLPTLLNIIKHSSHLIPSLHTLSLRHLLAPKVQDCLLDFLTTSAKIGKPITTLSITRHRRTSNIGDWGYLEAVVGLKVVFVIYENWKGHQGYIYSEYTCGGGHPEELNKYLEWVDTR